MPVPILFLPVVLVAAVSLLPFGRAARWSAVGACLVALAAAAASRVPSASASFNLINGVLLYGGLLLFGAALALAIRGRAASEATAAPVVRESTRDQDGRGSAWRRWAMPALLALLLLPALWFILTVAGPDRWTLQGLRDAPFSEAGETLLAALVLPATLILAGVWPFTRLAGGPRLAPLAALLLLVVIVPLAGDGLLHWRSAYAAWLVAGAIIAAVAPQWGPLLAAAGLFVIACGEGSSRYAGAALTVIGSLLAFRPPGSSLLRRAMYLAAGAGGIAGLRSTLANEVVYSVLMVLAVVLGLLRVPQDPR